MEAKKEAKKGDDQDLSMEEILQSIRKIIAEDDDPDKKPGDKKANGNKADDDVPGSDVLELTEMLKEDGTVESLKPEVVVKPEAAKEAKPADVLGKIDEALKPEKPIEKPAEKAQEKPPGKPAEPVAAQPEEKPAAPPEKPPEKPVEAVSVAAAAAEPAKPVAPAQSAPSMAQAEADALLSKAAAEASAAEFKRLQAAAEPPLPPVVTTPSPAFSSGLTVETMVMDMLKPMMKAWLDANLPAIVEHIVEREVRKITRH